MTVFSLFLSFKRPLPQKTNNKKSIQSRKIRKDAFDIQTTEIII